MRTVLKSSGSHRFKQKRNNVGVVRKIVQRYLPAQLTDFHGLARIRVEKNGGTDLQRHPQGDRVAEAVEERQDAEQPIARPRIDRLDHRLGIGGKVAVRQHHTLGIAGAAAGEDNRCQVIHPVSAQAQDPVFHHVRRQQDDGQIAPRAAPSWRLVQRKSSR